jgi:Flp pilus assembly protein TadD
MHRFSQVCFNQPALIQMIVFLNEGKFNLLIMTKPSFLRTPSRLLHSKISVAESGDEKGAGCWKLCFQSFCFSTTSSKILFAAGFGLLSWLVYATPGLATSAQDYRQMGLTYRNQERYPEAIAALQKAVDLEPENISGRVLLGWTQHRAGKSAEAADTLLQTFYLNPFDVPTLNALGIVYLVSGRLDAAVTAHTWAALLKPDNEIAYYNLSLAFERLKQYDWAVAMAREAAKLEPGNPHPPVAEAIAHWGNGDRPLAQSAYQQALTLDPRYNDPTFLEYLDEAGFSPDQIQRTKQVLQELRVKS